MHKIKRSDLVGITREVVERYGLDERYIATAGRVTYVAFGASHVGDVACIGTQAREIYAFDPPKSEREKFNGPAWDAGMALWLGTTEPGVAEVIDE